MIFYKDVARLLVGILLLALISSPVIAQTTPNSQNVDASSSLVNRYYDSSNGATALDLVAKAISANNELQAARLEIDRAKSRLRQAGRLLNPSVNFEQTTGRLTGSPNESAINVGVSYPVELGGKREKRKAVAELELEAIEADVKDRERKLASEVLTIYAEALTALRELEITDNITVIDLETTRIVQIRVNQGETAPLEVNLLQAEVERLRSRRSLTEGKLQVALLRLKNLAGMSEIDLLKLREQITSLSYFNSPVSLEASIDIALRTRPDLIFARISEEAAEAGLQLARADSVPNLVASTTYGQNRSSFDNTPVGAIFDRDRTLTFGVSIEIPIFNRNQSKKEEAAISIVQAKRRREFLESLVRSEVTSAYVRYKAAEESLLSFETGVIQRSNDNLRIIRGAYQLGEFRITELLNEQRKLFDAQKEFTDALTERYRAMADLKTAIGTNGDK